MYHKGNVHYDSWALAERRNEINSFLSHLNTKLQRQPVFCPKLHRLSGSPPQMDLLQIWVQGVEPMARQTIKKPITSQGGPRLSRPIFGLNCKIRQTGALIVGELLLLAVAVLQCSGQFTRLAGSKPVECIRGQGPDTTLACLLAGGAIQSQGSTTATTTWPDRGMSVPSCHQHFSTYRPLTPPSLVIFLRAVHIVVGVEKK